jgi:NodT family efflux transporter outer membrane factor (OMF) lipoprotein
VWGRIHTAVEGATANAQVFAADLENVRLSLQSTLAIDYFTLQSIDMQVAVLDDTITAYRTYLQLTINRFNGGVASRADVALAQTQLAGAQAQRTDLGVARAQFEHAIAVLTGQAPANFSLPTGKINGPPPEIPTAVPSRLLERRPDIAASERLIAVQNANIGLAKIAFYPTISLSGSAGLSGNALQNLFTWAAHTWSVGPNVSETLFDFGRRGATLQSVQSAYDASVASYRQTVLSAFEDVEDNLAALRILAEEATQQQEAVAAAEQSLALETDRYKAGTVSALDVITTQTIALTDERNAVAILQRRMTSAVNLIRALGGGWDASTLPSYDQLRSVGMADPKNTVNVAQPATP